MTSYKDWLKRPESERNAEVERKGRLSGDNSVLFAIYDVFLEQWNEKNLTTSHATDVWEAFLLRAPTSLLTWACVEACKEERCN